MPGAGKARRVSAKAVAAGEYDRPPVSRLARGGCRSLDFRGRPTKAQPGANQSAPVASVTGATSNSAPSPTVWGRVVGLRGLRVAMVEGNGRGKPCVPRTNAAAISV